MSNMILCNNTYGNDSAAKILIEILNRRLETPANYSHTEKQIQNIGRFLSRVGKLINDLPVFSNKTLQIVVISLLRKDC